MDTIERLISWLSKRVCISTLDGRCYVGTLATFGKDKDTLLTDTVELVMEEGSCKEYPVDTICIQGDNICTINPR